MHLWQRVATSTSDPCRSDLDIDLMYSDATRPSFALEVNTAVSQAKVDAMISTRDEDPDDWLDIDSADFDTMLENTLGSKSQSTETRMDVDTDENTDQEERIAEQQTAKLQEMAKKVEEFVEGKGDLEGARFKE